MKNEDGIVVSDLDGICNLWTDFYSSLFSACNIDSDVQADLLSNVSSFLSANQASLSEGYLTVSEVRVALIGMTRGKSLDSMASQWNFMSPSGIPLGLILFRFLMLLLIWVRWHLPRGLL